jgi:hypothetical protein
LTRHPEGKSWIKIRIMIKIRNGKASEDEGGAGGVLEGVFHGDMGCAEALEAVADRLEGQLGFVAFPAKMAQVKPVQLRGHDLLNQFGRAVIGKMTVPA